VAVLEGGTAAWRAAGLPLEAGPPPGAGDADDVYLRPYDRVPEQVAQAMRDYLEWETALLPRLEQDGTLRFARHD
jgi:3-mercaptopyruvate sulfurtransferase SseA